MRARSPRPALKCDPNYPDVVWYHVKAIFTALNWGLELDGTALNREHQPTEAIG